VPDHDDKGHMQVFYGVFNRADHGPVCYIAGHPQHEEIAQALVKHQFGSNAGIGARKNHGKRMLALCQFLPSIAVALRRSNAAAGAGVCSWPSRTGERTRTNATIAVKQCGMILMSCNLQRINSF
jgi:hypothetical protein